MSKIKIYLLILAAAIVAVALGYMQPYIEEIKKNIAKINRKLS